MLFMVLVSAPTLFETVSVTLYQPGAAYVTFGFCEVDVAGLPPGKLQSHEVIPAFHEASLNAIGSLTQAVITFAFDPAFPIRPFRSA
ncbi:hypothetical protein D3C80_1400670 [compost metagenome]